MSSAHDFSLNMKLREKLATYFRPGVCEALDVRAIKALVAEMSEAINVAERAVLEYLQGIEENPDDVLPKSNEAYRQLKRVATTFKAAADAIENKDELMTETLAAARSIEALNPVFAAVLASDISDEVLSSNRAPEPDELLAYAREADELARYFYAQPSHRKQKPLYRRDALIRSLVLFFWKYYPREELGVAGQGWDHELLDNCEGFIDSVLTEAEIPHPKSDPDRAGRLGEAKQGRLRRIIKEHLYDC